MHIHSDAELLEAWCAGDREAYAALVARHFALVGAACRRQAGSAEQEDCAQAVFLILARKPSAARRAPALEAWLLRVAWYVCRNARRMEQRRRRAEREAAVARATPADGHGEALDHLDGCLQTLSERQRAAVSLHYLAAKTPEEVAGILGTSRDNAYQLISRGLAALRLALARRGVAVAGAALAGLLAAEGQAAQASPAAGVFTALASPAPAVLQLAAGASWAMGLAWLMPLVAAAGLLLATGVAGLCLLTAPADPLPPLPPGHALPPGFSRPAWAVAADADGFGIWADLEVGAVRQRFRWIAPGAFSMGSPPEEQAAAAAGGAPSELVRAETLHQVNLTKGYWLADSPCTQALWSAGGMANDSRFTDDPERPVEHISWQDAQAFLEALNRSPAGRYFRLPTEAEWEFACRAGTATATYAGDLVYLGKHHAPVLDGIAWYGGNSGHGWTGADGVLADWAGKQYPEVVPAGTWPVKRLKPNAWGLYDMIGNVRQWCSDWYGEYDASPADDPVGPTMQRLRVSRGGAWDDGAAFCRAAFRFRYAPETKNRSQGFRLAAQSEPLALPPPPQAKPVRVPPPGNLSRAEIERRLAIEVSCAFQDESMATVVLFLEDTAQVPIRMSQEQLSGTTTFRIKGMRLHQLLDFTTRMWGTTWRIEEGAVVIGPEEAPAVPEPKPGF